MHCFQLTEKIEKGVLIHYPFLVLGEGTGREQLLLRDDDRAWINAAHGVVESGERFLFTMADVRIGRRPATHSSLRSGHRPWLAVCPNERDERALLLIRTMAGVGGKTVLTGNRHILEVLRSRCPDNPERLVILQPGGLLRIKRDGELEGAPPELVVGWDGREMLELNSAWQARP